MSRLLDLYPAAWRERYRAEMEDLLVAHPPTLSDQADILLGALDAWVHPQVRHAATPAGAERRDVRIAVGAAFLGGVLFVASGLAIASARIGPDGYRESGGALAILILGMLLTAIAALLSATDRPAFRTAMTMVGGALGTFLPWPLLIVGFYGYVVAALALGIVLLGRGRLVGLGLLAVGVLLPAFNTESEWALAAVPVGVLWTVIGLAIWRSPTAVAATVTRGTTG